MTSVSNDLKIIIKKELYRIFSTEMQYENNNHTQIKNLSEASGNQL